MMSAVFALYFILDVYKHSYNDPKKRFSHLSLTFSFKIKCIFFTKLVLKVRVFHIAASSYKTCIVSVPRITPMVSLTSMSN